MSRFKYRHSSIKLLRNDETRISVIRIENILLEVRVRIAIERGCLTKILSAAYDFKIDATRAVESPLNEQDK